MMNFLKLSPSTDVDMIDTLGLGDAHEEEINADLVEFGHETMDPTSSSTNPAPTAFTPGRISKATKKKNKVSDSWEDDMSDEDNSPDCSEASLHSKHTNNIEKVEEIDDETEMLSNLNGKEASIMKVLKAFSLLRGEFDKKFKVMRA